MAMAAAYHLPRPDNGPSTLPPNIHLSLYPRGLPLNDLDFKDNRYPTLSVPSMANQRVSAVPTGPADTFTWDSENDGTTRADSNPAGRFTPEAREKGTMRSGGRLSPGNGLAESYYQQQVQPSKLEAVLSYASSPQADTTRRVFERYSPDENNRESHRPSLVEPLREESVTISQQQGAGLPTSRERPNTMLSPWQESSLPTAGAGAGPNRNSSFSPIVPFSTSPLYNGSTMGIPLPISPRPRAYAQQPTYVVPSSAPNPMNPVYLSNHLPRQEDVCVECAMRDQDMADVDVTSPGVWDRESDALYDDLVRREQEEASEALSSESHKSNRSNRPRAKGGRLSESNLKLWLSVNPREPQARQQTLHLYLKTQQALLEAEILAHARAMQESRQLDTRMRDTYCQLRRSAYDIGISSGDESGGVRIMTPRSPAGTTGPGAHGHSHSREVTLLENGLIVEHVNVKKEEREARERKRKEEKRERSRARKSSRGSAYSVHSLAAPATDGGPGLRPHTRYSGSSSTRPTSVVTTHERPPSFPRAYSQASFSDVHSLGSGSPRQRFFGFRNLSSGWRSRDSLAPSGISGSMVDMHVALQREGFEQRVHSPVDCKTPSLRQSQVWPESAELLPQIRLDEIPKKKKKGLAKIWNTLTGSRKSSSQGGSYNEHTGPFDRTEDDLPLAPPPPLSYLVERGPGEHNVPIARQSTMSLPSTTSPKNTLSSPAMSPGTAASSLLPSPISTRPSNGEQESLADLRKLYWNHAELERAGLLAEETSKSTSTRNIQSFPSELDIPRTQQDSNTSSSLMVPRPFSNSRPQSILSREKSLPPLPPDENSRLMANQPDQRPQTVYAYDPRQRPPGASPPVQDFAAPRAPFYTAESKRQSLGSFTSRPNLATQTLPAKGVYAQEFMPSGGRYDEFGISRRSLGFLEHIEEKQAIPRSTTPSKRKSKFGFATFLGRKSQLYDSDILASPDFTRKSTSDGRDDVLSNGGYTNSVSSGPRMSVMSRKAIEELVSQDANFIAYRYPSSDQRLDVLR